MGLEEVELIVGLEKALGIEIPDRDTGAIRSPRDLTRYLQQRLADAGETRWSLAELELLVVGSIVEACEHDRFTLDTPFRDIFP
jgi:hypothetical protein